MTIINTILSVFNSAFMAMQNILLPNAVPTHLEYVHKKINLICDNACQRK